MRRLDVLGNVVMVETGRGLQFRASSVPGQLWRSPSRFPAPIVVTTTVVESCVIAAVGGSDLETIPTANCPDHVEGEIIEMICGLAEPSQVGITAADSGGTSRLGGEGG